MKSGLVKKLWNAGKQVGKKIVVGGIIIGVLGLPACSGSEGGYVVPISPNTLKTVPKEKSAYEVIANYNTLEEAQEWINKHIKYANQDLNERYGENYPTELAARLPDADNGADTQSLKITHRRGGALCRDAAYAVIATLSDNKDKYKSYYVGIDLKDSENGSNHAIAVVQDLETGLFGSGGINKGDYTPCTYKSIDPLVEKIADKHELSDQDNHSYRLYNFDNLRDPAHGTNDNLVLKDPFMVYSVEFVETPEGEILRQEREHGGIEQTADGGYLENRDLGYNGGEVRFTKYDPLFNFVYGEDTLNNLRRVEGDKIETARYNSLENVLFLTTEIKDDPNSEILYIDRDYDGVFDRQWAGNNYIEVKSPYNKGKYPPQLQSSLEDFVD